MSGTPYGLLGTPMMGQQPGSGLGSLYNAVVPPSTWGSGSPAQVPIVSGLPGVQWNAPAGTQWNGPGQALQTAPPPAPLPTYNQWGQMAGAQAPVPSLNTGPGLPQQAQQTGVGLAGLYDQWGRPTPQSVALAAAQSQQAPQQQGFDASGIDPRTMAALSASAPGLAALAALSGLPNPYAGVPQGGGGGLLGNVMAGEGSGGGDRGPSQGNQGQQDAATAAGGMAASGDKGPSAGGGTAASEDK